MVLASATAATVHQIFGEAALRLAHNNVTDLWFSMKREAAFNVRHKLWLIANRFIVLKLCQLLLAWNAICSRSVF
jgi:hypothetical protein